MARRQDRRRDERAAKAAKRKQSSIDSISIMSRLSTDWIVGGIIGTVLIIAILIFTLRQFVGSSVETTLFTQVNSLAFDQSQLELLVLADRSGMYFSENGGGKWEQTNVDSQDVRTVVSISSGGSSFLAAAGQNLLASNDGRIGWEPVRDGLPTGDVRGLAVDPLNPNVRYVFIFGHGLHKSGDGGKSWKLTYPDQEESMPEIAIKPGASSIVYAFHTKRGLIRSDNDGLSFSPVRGGVPWNTVTDLLTLPQVPDVIMAIAGGPSDRTFYKSPDNGQSWKRMSQGIEGVLPSAMSGSWKTGDIYLANTAGEIVKSSDGGVTWLRT